MSVPDGEFCVNLELYLGQGAALQVLQVEKDLQRETVLLNSSVLDQWQSLRATGYAEGPFHVSLLRT